MSLKPSRSGFKRLLNTCAWVLKLIYNIRGKVLVVSLLTQVFIAVLPFIRNRLFANVIDQIINSIKLNDNTWITPFIVFMVLSLFVSAAYFLQNYFSQMLRDYLWNDLRIIYINKVSSLDYQHFENKDTANLISKTNDEYRWRTQQVIDSLGDLLTNTLSLMTVAIVLLPHYWFLAILLALSQIPNVRLQYILVKEDWELYNGSSEEMRQGWDINWQLTNKSTLAEIKINNSKDFLFGKLIKIWDEFTEGVINIRRRAIPDQVVNIFVSTIVNLICLYFLINDIRTGHLSIGLFTFYFQTIGQVNDIFASFVQRFINISQQSLYISNFKKVMELSHKVATGEQKLKELTPPAIEFKHVSFKYPGSKRYIFKDLNLVINPGDEIAIVGANGAGKSTLIKLLLRYYDPVDGQILINGADLKLYKLADWYRHLSFLSQEFNTYGNLNLRDNIMIGRPQIKSDTRIVDSLKKADAFSFTSKYSAGLNTMMSQRYDGEEPSWGQWQKIAIARIFYRRSPIMLLDEPTASIDAVSEAKIFNNIYQKNQGKTLIIVSHRFSTVRNAKRIIVISRGQIIEQGSHHELIKLKGHYAHSFNLQASGYTV